MDRLDEKAVMLFSQIIKKIIQSAQQIVLANFNILMQNWKALTKIHDIRENSTEVWHIL